jgi:hypothetical protein
MCEMCGGFDRKDVLALVKARIAEHGFTMQGVSDPARLDDPTAWVYTIGLLDAAAHPEVIIAGADVTTASRVLGAVAEAVLDGERFLVGETIDLGVGVAEVGAVHPVQYELDTFAVWHALRDAGGLATEELTAVQIVLPAALCPFGERSWQPLLAEREARVQA